MMSLLMSRIAIPMYLEKKKIEKYKFEMDIVTVPGFVKFHNCFPQLDSSKIFIVHHML